MAVDKDDDGVPDGAFQGQTLMVRSVRSTRLEP
jgi:hypothetical protein